MRADPPCECQKRGVGCKLPYIGINTENQSFICDKNGHFQAKIPQK